MHGQQGEKAKPDPAVLFQESEIQCKIFLALSSLNMELQDLRLNGINPVIVPVPKMKSTRQGRVLVYATFGYGEFWV